MKASGVSLMPSSAPSTSVVAHRLELGDVGLVELRDVRQVHPARMQPRPGDALHARQRLDLRSAPNWAKSIPARSAGPAADAGRRLPAPTVSSLLDERLDVILGDAPLRARAAHAREIHAELAREPAHRGTRRARVEKPVSSIEARGARGAAATHRRLQRRGGLRRARRGVGCGDGRCRGRRRQPAHGAAGARCRRCGICRVDLRAYRDHDIAGRDVSPPLLTCTCSMTPATVDGTSIVAFSVSSVSSGVVDLDGSRRA